LAAHNINDIDTLAGTSVDDLVEILDLSLDEAEVILQQAKAVIAIRERTQAEADASSGAPTEGEEHIHAVSVEMDESAPEAEAASSDDGETDSTAAGYDEAVEKGSPFANEHDVLAQHSAESVTLTEIDPISEDQLVLEGAGRDLRPDTITPSPDLTSAAAAVAEHLEEEFGEGVLTGDESAIADATAAEVAASADESVSGTADAASSGDSHEDEKHDASPDAAN